MTNQKKIIFLKRLNFLIIILAIFFLLTVLFLLMSIGVVKNPSDSRAAQPTNFSITDACSIIAGKIIHPVDREEDCTTKCSAACEVIGLSYQKVEFEKNDTRCNQCSCFCR